MDRHNESKISIVIPAYNAGAFLADTLKSVLTQSYKRLEVILVDDGSTDNTKDVIKSFLDDSRVKYIFQTNEGLPSARNTGIQASTGSAIMFVDSDDLLPDGAVETLAQSLEKLDLGYCAVHGEMERFQNGCNTNIGITDYHSFSNSREKLITLRANFLLTCLFRREAVIQSGMFNEEMIEDCEDYDFILRVSRLGKFQAINKVVYKYRVHPSSKSQNLSIQRVEAQVVERHKMFCRILRDEAFAARLLGWSTHYHWAGVDYHRHNPYRARFYWFKSMLFNPFQMEPLKLIRASLLKKIP